MKKIIAVTLLFIAISSFAQAPLDKKKFQLNAGFGSSGWGTPIYAGVDYGLTDEITAGVEASYQSYKIYNITSTIIGFQLNGNYHFNKVLDIPSNWDFYAGVGLNYYKWTVGDSNNSINIVEDEPFNVGAQVGGRYFFNSKFGINLELGGGTATSGGKIGITYILM